MVFKIMHLAIVFTLLLAGATVFKMNNTLQKKNYFILQYTPEPSWDEEKASNEQVWFGEHSRFLSSLRTSGKAKIGVGTRIREWLFLRPGTVPGP